MNLTPSSSSPIPKQISGHLLLAAPFLRDGTFNRSVIYIDQHDSAEGTHGLILNQPMGQEISQLVHAPEFAIISHLPVYVGGPVNNTSLSFAAFWWDEQVGTMKIKRLTSVEEAAAFDRSEQVLVKAFAGHTGWSTGQLEDELERETWIISSPTERLLKRKHDIDLWASTLRDMSAYHKLLAETPSDPFAN